MKKILVSIAIVCCGLIILNSCSLGGYNTTTTQPQGSYILFGQASPDAPPLTLNVGGSPYLTGLLLGNVTRYASVDPGTYTFSVSDSGSSTALVSSTLTLSANTTYSYFIIDSVSKLKATVTQDIFKIPSADSAYVRFFNFCPNLTQSISVIDSASKSAWFATRVFNDQATNPTQFNAFNEIKIAGTTGAHTFYIISSSDTLATQKITFSGSHVYTLYAKGFAGNVADTSKRLSIGIINNYGL